MAELSAEERNELPEKKFALEDDRKYPVPDKSHATNAKARAKQQLDKGKLSAEEYREIVAKADKVLKSLK